MIAFKRWRKCHTHVFKVKIPLVMEDFFLFTFFSLVFFLDIYKFVIDPFFQDFILFLWYWIDFFLQKKKFFLFDCVNNMWSIGKINKCVWWSVTFHKPNLHVDHFFYDETTITTTTTTTSNGVFHFFFVIVVFYFFFFWPCRCALIIEVLRCSVNDKWKVIFIFKFDFNVCVMMTIFFVW